MLTRDASSLTFRTNKIGPFFSRRIISLQEIERMIWRNAFVFLIPWSIFIHSTRAWVAFDHNVRVRRNADTVANGLQSVPAVEEESLASFATSTSQKDSSIANVSSNNQEPRGKAFEQQTPHSGRHFVPSHPAYRHRRFFRRRGRFMEGWYYRLTTSEGSFAIIPSIEDAGNPKSDLKLACIQIVGPDNTYLVQADVDDTKFWAWKKQQGLGFTFDYEPDANVDCTTTALEPFDWHRVVKSGFQILPDRFLGKIHGHDGSMGGVLPGQGVPGTCSFDFSVKPICGWGDTKGPQKRTGGWLSRFAIFEPHWQVTLADGRATGTITWQNRTISFVDAPFYAEKNWGAALPSKWYWTQCNSFPGYEQLSVTAGGGIRKLPFGGREALGMVCVHVNGTFYEATPWTGSMSWKVETWGNWELSGRSVFTDRPFEVEISYRVDPSITPGLVFRAPTPDEGMVLFCRDTFEAQTTLTLWELVWDKETKEYIRKPGPPLIDQATSNVGGAEVGGGPWWDTWKATSQVSKPVMFALRLPLRAQALINKIKQRKRRNM